MNNPYINNPLFQRAIQMTQNKTNEEKMQTIQNVCNNMGIDINSAYQQFCSFMKQFNHIR